MVAESAGWSWEIAEDPEEVHELLCASDAHHATEAVAAPRRNYETTCARVRAGAVSILRVERQAVAMFTLTREPPFAQDTSVFPPARRPAYLARVAVRPEWLERDRLIGLRCIRRAAELAEAAGCDVLRSEANPDLLRQRELLSSQGFEEYASWRGPDGLRRVYLQKVLRPGGEPAAA